MADLNDLFTGTPPTYGVQVVGGGRSPFYGPAKQFGSYLMSLLGQPLPSYQGQVDPGMSPTLSALGQMLQGYSRSPLPGVMGQSQGVLGRFMNPSFANPMSRMQFGFPQYFGNQPGGGFQAPGSGGMTNPFMGGQNPFNPQPQPGGPMSPPQPISPGGYTIPDESGQVPPTPPWMQPSGGGPTPQAPPTSINGGGLMGGGSPGLTNAAMPGVVDIVKSASSSPSGMTAGIANEVPFSMAGRTPQAPTPPPLRPGQMTRQQWIDAGMTPGGTGGNIKNAGMAIKVPPIRPKKKIRTGM